MHNLHVVILMSVYNGECFLGEQLNSLLNQSYKNFSIYIRDDGSSDKTVDLVNSYREKHKNIFLIAGGNNLGVVGSFFYLLKKVCADVYFFCDQDDWWLENKLAVFIEEYSQVNSELPSLLHSDLNIVDNKLNQIAKSFYDYTGISSENIDCQMKCFIENNVVGCSMMINKALRDFVLSPQIELQKLKMHDWWIYMIAKNFGRVVYINEALVNYRQHSNNQCGSTSKHLFELFKKICTLGKFKKKITERRAIYIQVKYFYDLYSVELDDKTRDAVYLLLDFYNKSFFLRVISLCKFYKKSIVDKKFIFDMLFVYPLKRVL